MASHRRTSWESVAYGGRLLTDGQAGQAGGGGGEYAVDAGLLWEQAQLDILQDPLQTAHVLARLQRDELLLATPGQEGCTLHTTDQSLPSTEENRHLRPQNPLIRERHTEKDGPWLLLEFKGKPCPGADGPWCSEPWHAPLPIFGSRLCEGEINGANKLKRLAPETFSC